MTETTSEIKHWQNDPAIFSSNPMIIFMSDIHLGALANYHPQALEFIGLIASKKASGALPNLKALVITGDFFDVLNDSVRDLMKKGTVNSAIFNKLNEIHDLGVKIFFSMGNHEISFYGSFKSHKKSLFKQVRKYAGKYGYELRFLVDNQAGDYLMLQTANSIWNLKVYNKAKDIKKGKYIGHFDLGSTSGAVQKYNCLITHGHQFLYWFSKFCGFFMWSPLIKAPDFVKEFMNIAWNLSKERADQADFIMSDLTEADVEKIIEEWKKDKSEQEIIETADMFQEKSAVLKMILKVNKFMQRNQSKRDGKLKQRAYCTKHILKDVKKHAELEIDHVIYGHSHDLHKEQHNIDGMSVLIGNSGSWQDANSPGFIEFLKDGEFYPYFY